MNLNKRFNKTIHTTDDFYGTVMKGNVTFVLPYQK